MNRRLSKRINKKTVDIFIAWLKTVVAESEHEKINPKEYKSYVPENAYYWRTATLLNSIFSPRWIKRKLKLKLRRNPLKPVEDYCLEEFR